MAVYTPLTAEQIAGVLRAFGLAAPDRVQPEPRGGVNTNYHVWSGGRRWFLRVAEGKTEADVRFEAEVHRYLHEARFPVAQLLPAADGRPFVPVLGKPAMLFSHAPGEEVTRAGADAGRCRRLGEQLGRLHDLGAGFPEERANPYGPARVRAWLEALEPDGGGDPEVAAALPLLRDELSLAGSLPGVPRGLVHCDLFADNVLWIGDRVSAVLDWEMSCVDAFAFDLGVALSSWCYTDGYDQARARALLGGYRARRETEPDTVDALYPFARYAALRFAASRIHGYHRAALGAERLARKDWRRYRDRLVALREMGEGGFRTLVGA
ncbi:MAG TPA: homoserine kinase [Anaeromyxobacteraceae bacterium]|nr:homoserine kinase [Anaeromyxobacteraceae bacterium]